MPETKPRQKKGWDSNTPGTSQTGTNGNHPSCQTLFLARIHSCRAEELARMRLDKVPSLDLDQAEDELWEYFHSCRMPGRCAKAIAASGISGILERLRCSQGGPKAKPSSLRALELKSMAGSINCTPSQPCWTSGPGWAAAWSMRGTWSKLSLPPPARTCTHANKINTRGWPPSLWDVAT